MHNSSILRMKWFVDNFVSKIQKKNIKVLDVGSYDVNGCYKHLFEDAKFMYTGLDIESGPNVDITLANPYDWSSLETDSYDVVVSGQALEHVEFFWVTMSEMARVLRKDGLICLIVPNGFREHRYPVDCYRFFTDGVVALARYCELDILHAHTNSAPSAKDLDWYSEKYADSMLVAKKPYDGETRHLDLKNYVCEPMDHKTVNGGFIPYKRKRGVKRYVAKLFGK